MCRKYTAFASSVIPVCLEWMTDREDEESWHTTNTLDEDESSENHVVGEQAMDRVARALGGKSVLPITFNYVPTMLGNGDRWQSRVAGLLAISAIAEGCVKIMAVELDKILKLILPYLRDPHPQVRWAACNAVGQLSTDFAVSLANLSNSHHLPSKKIPISLTPSFLSYVIA